LRVPPENRLAFDKLTEYADLLLTNGTRNGSRARKYPGIQLVC
jgi:hypothetical protein